MSILIFTLVRLLPGDVVDALLHGDVVASTESKQKMRVALGLADPLPVQFLSWVRGLATGRMGDSLVTGSSISNTLAHALPITLELTLLATVIATLIAIPLGVVSASNPKSGRAISARLASLVGLSVPDFWLATLILLCTSLFLHWIPPVIWIPFTENPLGNLVQVAIPATVLAVTLMATTMRMTRATMLEVLTQDYIRTARAKGCDERTVIYRHALRNGLIPVITVIGFQVGSLMSGATIIETIFGLPGMGYTLTQSIYHRDYPVIEDSALFLAATFVLINLVVDLFYGLLDPRVRRE
jgi:peptide/nickel transport system permease protein